MATNKRRVAVIGAGLNGIVCVKYCLEEGLEPVCYEQHADLGGIWNFTEEPRSNQGAASFESLTTNTSKEMMALSDFPFAAGTDHFLRHSDFNQYLTDYAEHFGVRSHIRFNTEVREIKQADDYDTTGRWQVSTFKDNTEQTQVFDYVAICSGFLRQEVMPTIEGIATFPGTVLHMKQFRTNEIFKNKRVLVVGNGSSASDAATEAGRVSKQAYLAVGKGAYLTSLTDASRPTDLKCRLLLSITRLLPVSFLNSFIRKQCLKTIDLPSYNLDGPPTFPDGAALMATENLKFLIMSGRVKIRRRLMKFDGSSAHFSDGQHHEVDVVIFATGYKSDYSFLKDCPYLPDVSDASKLKNYKLMFPAHLPYHSMSFHGAFRVIGAHSPSVELQARFMAMVASGKKLLPDREEMLKDIEYRVSKFPSTRHMHMLPMNYADELANCIGVYPSFWKLFLISPITAVQVYLTPPISMHYRLVGHGCLKSAWTLSKEAYYRIKLYK